MAAQQGRKQGPGRPKDEEKRKAILDAACRQFLENGIAATRVDRIASEAGVSKMTVYAHFGDKAGLFAASVRSRTETLAEALADLPDPPADLRRALITYGTAFVLFLRSPDVLRLDLILATEAATHPEIAAAFYESGPGVVLGTVTGILRQACERGMIRLPDVDKAADSLVASWCHGPDWIAQRLALRGPPTREEAQERVQRSVDWFLAAHAVKPQD
nr:TetR/AcrR family transcriptional regulator [Telmatospirillum sp. J64-1]